MALRIGASTRFPRTLAATFATPLIALSLATIAAPARAQQPAPVSPSDRVAAQALFDEGRSLMQRGKFSEACPKFEKSQRIDPAGGTLLNLALCHEKEGKIASAWSEYEDAIALARRDGRKDREELADERLKAVQPRLPRLSVELAPPVPDGTDVQIDGVSLSRNAWSVATPFDPGPHDVKVTAPGKAVWSRAITLHEGETQHVPVMLENGTSSAPAPATGSAPVVDPCAPGAHVPGVSCTQSPPASSPSSSAPAAGAPQPPPPRVFVMPAAESPSQPGHRTTGFYVLGGVGVAALVTSVVTGIVALDLKSSSSSKCLADRNFCPDVTGIDDAHNARTMAWVSTVSLVGAVVAVTAALLLPLRYDAPATKASTARR